jgi:hypothetical protein
MSSLPHSFLPHLLSLLIHPSIPLRPPIQVSRIFRRRLTILQMRVWALYACWYARWCWLTLFGAFMRLCGGRGWWLAFCSLLLWESYDGERGKSINPPRRLPPLRDQLTAVSGASQLLVLGNRCLPHLD